MQALQTDTTQLPPFETLLPKLSEYGKALEKGYHFRKEFCSQFDQSKWEDRFFMFIHIARNCHLEDDPRLPYHKWVRKIVRAIDGTVEDNLNPKTMSDLEWECLIEEIAHNFPIVFKKSDYQEEIETLTELMSDWGTDNEENYGNVRRAFVLLYHKHYPHTMVVRNDLGKFVDQVANRIESDTRLIDLAQATGNTLIFTIEQLSAKINHLTEQGEELFLYKGDINWKELTMLRMKMDDLDWYYRNFQGTCVLSDWFSTPYKSLDCDYGTFMIDLVLFRIIKAFGVDTTEYTKDLKSNYQSLWLCNDFCQTDEYWESEIEDFYLKTIPYWIKHNGDTLFPNGK